MEGAGAGADGEGDESGGLCRVCLSKGARLSLFHCENDVKLSAMVMECTSVRICEEDGLPDAICAACHDQLNTAIDFKRKCESSDLKLRGFEGTLKVETETDDVPPEEEMNEAEAEEEEPPPVELVELPVKKKRKRVSRPAKRSSPKMSSHLLEGKCIWTGSEWRFEITKKEGETNTLLELADVKDENEEPSPVKLGKLSKEVKKRKLMKKIKSSSSPPSNPNDAGAATNLCDTCGKTFRSKYHLKYHIVLKHQEAKGNIKCSDPNCKKIFKLDNYMMRHVKRCHSAKREFICNECGKQYAFISGLKQHMKSHSDNPVWKHCNFCTQKYRTQKSVDIHIRSVHTGERPSVCSVCDSAFYHDDYLKEHMRLHTGETPYKCPICKRGYAQRGNMKSHMKQHRLSELDEATKSAMKPNYLKLLRNC